MRDTYAITLIITLTLSLPATAIMAGLLYWQGADWLLALAIIPVQALLTFIVARFL